MSSKPAAAAAVDDDATAFIVLRKEKTKTGAINLSLEVLFFLNTRLPTPFELRRSQAVLPMVYLYEMQM